MKRNRAIILFAAVFVAALILLFPIGLALQWAGATSRPRG